MLDLSSGSSLSAPQQGPITRHKSPSQQAAALAASRAQPAASQRKPVVAPKPRRSSADSRSIIEDSAKKPTDDTSIPPTNALVDLFERRQRLALSPPAQRPHPITVSAPRETPIESPKPIRSGITSMIRMEVERAKQHGQHASQATMDTETSGVHAGNGGESSNDSFASASESLNPSRHQKASPAKTARGDHNMSLATARDDVDAFRETKRRLASVSPMRNTVFQAMPIRPLSRSSTVQSARSVQAQFNQAYPRRMTPLTTGDQLANALVASSLASSRAPSPTRLEPPPVPHRRRKSHHSLGFGRTPSPAKGAGMLQTLRPQNSSSSSDSDDELHPYRRHKKKRLVRKHPNKHHEGDRKRWRDAVTERERKRYEGVWAANKGIHISLTLEEQQLSRHSTDAEQAVIADQVSNIVTREIWNRSRLPEATLETVWDLVDNRSIGRLDKMEFVVGLWLIDQRLKGRKLPVRITDSIWDSVRGMQGIKIRK